MEARNRIVPGSLPDVKARPRRTAGSRSWVQFLRGTCCATSMSRGAGTEGPGHTGLLETVRDIWSATLVKETPPVDYARQIRERLARLYAIHPRLVAARRQSRVFGSRTARSHDLLERVPPSSSLAGAPGIGAAARRLQRQQHRLRPPTGPRALHRRAPERLRRLRAGHRRSARLRTFATRSEDEDPRRARALNSSSRVRARVRAAGRRRSLRDAAEAVPGALVHHLGPLSSPTRVRAGRSSCRACGCSSARPCRPREDRGRGPARRVVHRASRGGLRVAGAAAAV